MHPQTASVLFQKDIWASRSKLATANLYASEGAGETIAGLNKKFRDLYNNPSIYATYDFGERVMDSLFWKGQLRNSRQSIMNLLDIKPYSSVLCVSVGTGRDFDFISPEILKTLHIVGLDISSGMLARARKKFNRRGIPVDLFLGNAESLPFMDNSFDTVFHFGGINFFTAPATAVNELYRVAKPGSTILYGDETEKFVKNNYKKMPVVKNAFKNVELKFDPMDWLPSNAVDPLYHEFGKQYMYAVTFRKPVSSE